jgi:23S rRNA pseudouridine955/2504/2580 synthase
VRQITVADGVRAMSLARYLSRAFPMCPGPVLRGALKRRDVRVNGLRAGGDAQIDAGDRLIVYISDRFLTAPAKVLYEDAEILALEKPQGLPVDADADGIGEDTLLSRARALRPSAKLCHRLDAGTGGVVLLALTDGALARLADDFKNRRVQKTYRCLVAGRPEKPEGVLTAYLLKDAAGARVREAAADTPGALRATMGYRLIEPRRECSLIEIDLGTGRTHQIRAQMALIGHPVVGDDKYGDRSLNRRLKAAHPALWCARLQLADGRAFSSEPDF